MSSTEADSAAATASDPGGVASSAPENISSGALAATASTSPADPDPATVDQSNPYVLALLGIRHDATTEVSQSFLRPNALGDCPRLNGASDDSDSGVN